MTKRTYTPRLRAEKQGQTRARIVEAVVALHEELGPRATTISAIAERAGVQRLTVYRHFPDEEALFAACTSHWAALNPPPDPGAWAEVADPRDRTRAALGALYGYFRRTERMWRASYRDVEEVPALQPAMAAFESYLDAVRDDLAAAWDAGEDARTRAALGHAVRFSTWRSLAEEGLADGDMAAVVARWIESLRQPERASA